MKLTFFSLLLLLTGVQCARQCPADINLGSLNLQDSTLAYLPSAQRVNTMTFVNAAGQTLTFTNNGKGEEYFHLPVATLCDRGDFLDKTTQTEGFNAQSFHYYYAAPGQTYTLAIDISINNAGNYGSASDTILYETVGIWGQKTITPTASGSVSLIGSERGNSANIPAVVRDIYTNLYRIVPDTTLNGRHIVNALVPVAPNNSMMVFYTQTNGYEAFITGNEVWTRQ